jgi:PAS domain S-box-containing protein
MGLSQHHNIFPVWLIFLLAGLFIVIGITVFFIYFLKKQVDKQTVKITAQNISLQQLNDTLSENENRFRNLFEYSGVGVAQIDSATNMFIRVNAMFCHITGYSKDDLSDMDFIQITHPDDIKKDLEKRKELSKGKINSFSIEKRYIHKNGEFIWVELTVTPLIKSQKGFDYHIAVVKDITKRKEAEEEIARLATFPLQNPYPVMRISENGDVLFKNKSAEEILSHIAEYKELQNKSGFQNEIIQALSNNKIYTHEYSYNKKTVLLAFSPIAEYRYVNIYGIDITDLKKTQKEKEKLIEKLETTIIREKSSLEELEASYEEMAVVQEELEISNIRLEKALIAAQEANILKTEFLANMSHEIRTPLTAILGFNSLMSTDDNLNEEQKENLSLIKLSGERLLNLLMDILSVSQIETGKVQIKKTNIILEKLFSEIKDVFSLRFKEKQINFTFNTNGIEIIYTDEKRLNQILINLIGNAIKFTDKGSISLELVREDDFYVFSVTDEGIGIEKKLQKNIFDSFVIGEVGYTKTYQGAGLGLTICKRLTELLGGEISVQSELTKGSKFYFSIPVEEQNLQPVVEKTDKREIYPSNNNLNIAIVDDEEMILKYVEMLIQQKTNHKIKCFSFCKDFFKTDLSAFDLILLDIRMPDVDGVECLKRIKKQYSKLPVIALTVSLRRL